MIYGIVKAQKLDLRAQAAADTIDYLTAKFSFLSADWDGLVKYAHFQQGNTRYSVQLTDDKITESDHLNLAAGEWQVYLHGNEYRSGDVIKRITTNIATFTVEPTGALNGEPFPEADPSVVEQLAADVADHEERITALENADYGEMTEIMRSQGVSRYTASEIGVMYDNKKPMCYNGTPVTSVMILTLAGGAKEAYLGVLYGGTTATEARTLKINENKQITVYENGTTITEAQINKLAGIEAGAEVNKVIDVLDSDGNSVVGADRKARLPQSGGGTVTDVQDEQGNSLVSEGIATIPSEVVEIIRLYRLAYTPSEVETMFRTKELKISGKTVVDIYSYGTGVSLNTQIYFIDRDDGEEYLYYNEYSNNGTAISTRNKVGRWSEANYTLAEKIKLQSVAAGAEAPLTTEQSVQVCSIIADFITDGTNIIGVDSETALAF